MGGLDVAISTLCNASIFKRELEIAASPREGKPAKIIFDYSDETFTYYITSSNRTRLENEHNIESSFLLIARLFVTIFIFPIPW